MSLNKRLIIPQGDVCTTSDGSFPITNLVTLDLDGDALDSSGNGYDASTNLITYSTGQFNNVADFPNNNSQYLQFSDSVSLTTRTISFWINFDSIKSTSQFILDSNDRYQSANAYGNWAIHLTNNTGPNNFRFVYDRYNGSSYGYMYKTKTFTAGIWYHIVFQASANNHKVWINGTEETGFTTVRYTSLGTVNLNVIRVGMDTSTTFDQPLDGKIDQLRIFNSEITDAQVLSLYNDEIPC